MGRIIVLAWSRVRFVAVVVAIDVVGLVWSARPQPHRPDAVWA